MTRYLLDNNVVSELRKTRPHGAVTHWLQALASEQIFVSAVTLGELQAGVELNRKQDPARAREIEAWLVQVETSFACLPMTTACFREWARIVAATSVELRDDAMIAATARVHGLTVATRNEKNFKRLGLKRLNPFKVHLNSC